MDFFIFFFGIVLGSFLNVCIYRIPRKLSLITPASSCPSCGTRIKFYHNIPLISYLLLRGKCAYCGAHIPARYFLVELLSGLFAVIAYRFFGLTPAFAFYLLLLYVLLVVAMIDFERRIIPNKILLTGFILAVGLNLTFSVVDWRQAALGFVISGGVLYLLALVATFLFKKESMGMGDVKLAAFIGFFLGWKLTLAGLYFGFFFALIYYVILNLFKKQPTDKYVPMAPFFSLGIVILLFWGNQLTDWYIKFVLN